MTDEKTFLDEDAWRRKRNYKRRVIASYVWSVAFGLVVAALVIGSAYFFGQRYVR